MKKSSESIKVKSEKENMPFWKKILVILAIIYSVAVVGLIVAVLIYNRDTDDGAITSAIILPIILLLLPGLLLIWLFRIISKAVKSEKGNMPFWKKILAILGIIFSVVVVGIIFDGFWAIVLLGAILVFVSIYGDTKDAKQAKEDMNPIFTDDGKFFFCECGAKVSVDAKACPSCGDTKAKAKALSRIPTPLWLKAVPWVIIGLIVFGISKCVSSLPDTPTPTAANPRNCMLSSDSVSRSVRDGVINNLNDPDSFEFIRGQDMGADGEGLRKYKIVYSANNHLGGRVQGLAYVWADKKCNPVRVDLK